MGWQDAPAVDAGAGKAPAWASAPTVSESDPTAGMSTGERLAAGTGRGMAAGARGITGALGASPLGAINRTIHDLLPALGGMGRLPTPQEAEAAQQEAARLEAPLLATKAGKVGNVLGAAALAAPTALIPGANTATGATLIGALTGGLTTEGGANERAQGAGLGAAGGIAGKYLGDTLGAGARAVADFFARRTTAANTAALPRMAAAQAGAREGYVVPPADLQPGLVTEALSGVSGKIKTAQAASARNQSTTNELAARALGLPPGTQITPDVLQAARTAAGQAYAPIRAAGDVTADATYGKALDSIAGQYQGAARSFPGAAKNPVLEMVDGLRQSKFDAGDALDMVKVLRETADKAYRTGDTGLGKASKAAAGALEEQLERHLAAAGNKDALTAFKAARQEIAKTYTVQKGLNAATGDINAAALARDLQKGKPLSGDLRTIAEFAAAFPRATQSLKEAPKAWSPLDAVAGVGGVGMGSPALLALAAGRPAARSLLLSGPMQRAALQQSSPGLLTQLPAAVLEQQLIRRLLPGAGGVTAPLALTSE